MGTLLWLLFCSALCLVFLHSWALQTRLTIRLVLSVGSRVSNADRFLSLSSRFPRSSQALVHVSMVVNALRFFASNRGSFSSHPILRCRAQTADHYNTVSKDLNGRTSSLVTMNHTENAIIGLTGSLCALYSGSFRVLR